MACRAFSNSLAAECAAREVASDPRSRCSIVNQAQLVRLAPVIAIRARLAVPRKLTLCHWSSEPGGWIGRACCASVAARELSRDDCLAEAVASSDGMSRFRMLKFVGALVTLVACRGAFSLMTDPGRASRVTEPRSWR